MPTDLVPALRLAWRIATLGSGSVLLLPFLLPQSMLAHWVPACSGQSAGTPCPLCGMTTAFYHLSSGDWSSAQAANPYSLGLYAFLILNLIVMLVVSFARIERKASHAAH